MRPVKISVVEPRTVVVPVKATVAAAVPMMELQLIAALV